MTRQMETEVKSVKQRLASAVLNPVQSRRAAAQFAEDLHQWNAWKADGVELPRLPRRIRIGLLAKTTAQRAPKRTTKNKYAENVQIEAKTATKSMNGALPTEEMFRYLVADRNACLVIAKAITISEQIAEDVISDVWESAVEQISRGVVRADNPARFHAWLHTIVRRNAMRRAGQSESKFVQYTEDLEQSDFDFGCTQVEHERVWGAGKGAPHAD